MSTKISNRVNHIVTWVFIPFILVTLWLGFSLYFTSQYSVTVIATPHNVRDFTSYKTSELLQGQKIAARFQAKENNLGIVSVRFDNFQRISDDSVVFRLRELGSKEWFYENTYKVNQFQPDELFTFGFPIIPDSRGKTYTFEIESTKGRRGDAIGLSSVYPPFVTQYQYSKEVLLTDKAAVIPFLLKKLYYSFTDKNFFISSLVYLLPLIFYLMWGWYVRVLLEIRLKPFPHIRVTTREVIPDAVKKNYLLIYIYLTTLLTLVFFMEKGNGYVTVMLILLYFWLMRVYRFNSSISYSLSLFFLILCPLLLLFNNEETAQRSALWVYIFLVIGTVKSVLEIGNNDKYSLSYEIFKRNNIKLFNQRFKKYHKKN